MSIFKDIIKEINNNEVTLKNGEKLIILKVEPINFKLKSMAEQELIINSYRSFFKQCDFDIQIFIQTQKADVKKHIKQIEKCILYEEEISDMAKDYIHLIKEISEVRGSVSRKFFIVLPVNEEEKENKMSKVREGLESCGNIVRLCNTNELIQILKFCFKKIPTTIAAGSM